MDQGRLSRPLSLYFSLREYIKPKLVNTVVLQAITSSTTVAKENIKGIQILIDRCIITLTDQEAKESLRTEGFTLRNGHVTLFDADLNITNVTIKDAPVEMNDNCLTAMLKPYGNCIEGTLKKEGKSKAQALIQAQDMSN